MSTIDPPPPPPRGRLLLYRTAARARVGVMRLKRLRGAKRWIHALRYGRLSPRGPDVCFGYVGRADRLDELFPFCWGGQARSAWREEIVAEGNALSFLPTHRPAASFLEGVDLLALDPLLMPGAFARSALRFAPHLQAVLPLYGDVEAQLSAVRSKSYRRVLKQQLREGVEHRFSTSIADLDRFYDEMYAPQALHRFGGQAHISERAELASVLTAGRGGLLLVERDGRPHSGALCFVARSRPDRLSIWKSGTRDPEQLDPATRRARSAALEVAIFQHAISQGFASLDFGLANAVANDGIFVHKRRLGCDFQAVPGAAESLLLLPAQAKPAVLEALPLIVRGPDGLCCLCGYTGSDEGGDARLRDLLRDCAFPALHDVRVFYAGAAAGDEEYLVGLVESAHSPLAISIERS